MSTTPPIRVMIVDDSSVVRRLLTQALVQHPEIEVVGSAANGVIALNKLDQLKPDVVILDIEMPEMDGITTLTRLRQRHPRLPVVMFSTLTERGANITFDALAAGASDYVLKPTTQGAGETLENVVATALVPKLVALTRSRFGLALQATLAAANELANQPRGRPSSLGGADTGAQGARPSSTNLSGASSQEVTRPIAGIFAPKPRPALGPSPPPSPVSGAFWRRDAQQAKDPAGAPPGGIFSEAPTSRHVSPPPPMPAAPVPKPIVRSAALQQRKSVQVIGIASSTGGPNALAEVLPRLPLALPVPVLVVQHMPAIFTRTLADRLSSRCELKVREATARERLAGGHVYIAPGNRHLEVVREGDAAYTQLTDGPHENSCRPAADVLFRSLVRVYGGSVLCIVLTGMGHDGLRGAREIYEAGGRVLVQSGPTCVIWGMPRAVEEAGIAEAVVPLPELAAAILQRVGNGLLPLRTPESEKGR